MRNVDEKTPRTSPKAEALMAAALIMQGLLANSCATRPPEVAGPPPVPEVEGALAIDVVYPRSGSLISARDSNFVFGSVGNGKALLTINGHGVPVQPNGAFIAWLPVPASPGDSVARYEIVASLGDEERRAAHLVRLPRPPALLRADSAEIDAAGLSPRGAWWVKPGEAVPIRLRASPSARVRLLLPDGDTVPLSEVSAHGNISSANWIFGRIPQAAGTSSVASGIYEGTLVAREPLGLGTSRPDMPPVPATPAGAFPYCSPRATPDEPAADSVSKNRDETVPQGCAVVEAVVASDTARFPLPLDLWVLSGEGPVVALQGRPSYAGERGYVVGRAAPGATTLWMWADGVVTRVTGRRNNSVRLFCRWMSSSAGVVRRYRLPHAWAPSGSKDCPATSP
jgi:N-acetylmuramoyl-L-alanine amidase